MVTGSSDIVTEIVKVEGEVLDIVEGVIPVWLVVSTVWNCYKGRSDSL